MKGWQEEMLRHLKPQCAGVPPTAMISATDQRTIKELFIKGSGKRVEELENDEPLESLSVVPCPVHMLRRLRKGYFVMTIWQHTNQGGLFSRSTPLILRPASRPPLQRTKFN